MIVDKIKLKLQKREAVISVIGLGYVGLPLALRFSEEGFRVYGHDIDIEKIKSIKSGASYISSINKKKVQVAINKNFNVSVDYTNISLADIIVICVPTPLNRSKEPNLKYIQDTLKSIKPFLKENQTLILESTTYPGTTKEILLPFANSIVDSKNRKKILVGTNFFIGYSPEREDPGNLNFETKDIPRVISGITKSCVEIMKSIYSQIVIDTITVSSTDTAEMTKMLENTYRAVNIGLINEFKMISEKMNIDIFEVIEAAKTKPFGFTPYYPGPGLGGHCIPIDPMYLSWKANEMGISTKFIQLANEINNFMPEYILERIKNILEFFDKKISQSKILVLGLSYKKNIDDVRESPSLEIINKLIKCGADVNYSDPFFPHFPVTRKFKFNLKCIKLDKKNINDHDLVLIASDHDSFDYNLIKNESNLIIDTRGRFKTSKKVFSA